MISSANLIHTTVDASRESKLVEFKSAFDPASPKDWCEIVKDIVAMANLGGGVFVFGANDDGSPAGENLYNILALDSARITDKIAEYTGEQFADFEIHKLERQG